METKEILELVKKIEIIKMRFAHPVDKARNIYPCMRCKERIGPENELTAKHHEFVRYGIANETMCVPCFEAMIKQLTDIEV